MSWPARAWSPDRDMLSGTPSCGEILGLRLTYYILYTEQTMMVACINRMV